MNAYKFFTLLFFASFTLFSCSSYDDVQPVVEEEVITTLTVNMTSATGDDVILTYRDLDAEGPNPPIVSVSGDLTANASYTASITVLNETVTPTDNITLEIIEEDELHQFFYVVGGLNISNVTYLDFDGNGNPLGVNFSFDTGAASQGNMTVVLIHEPNKTAQGVSTGELANAGGETDISATFPLVIQ